MTLTRVLCAATVWALSLAALELNEVVGPLVPERIHVRWTTAVPAGERARVERELGLRAGQPLDYRTFAYILDTRSRRNIERVVRHPLIEGTGSIDRERFTLIPDLTGEPAWIQAVALNPLFQEWEPRLTLLALSFAAVGLAFVWPPVSSFLRALPRRAAAMFVDGKVHPAGSRWSLGRPASTALALVMLVSLSLRAALVFSGGQFYWADEGQYRRAREIAATAGHGAVPLALQRMSNGQHPLFTAIAVIPAMIERLTGADTRIPGVFFATFSVLNIGLLALIAKRNGASDIEAVLAAALLAASASFFYYARHLLPYDAAMFFGLVALYFGADERASASSTMRCGVFAGCCFLTYLGYWTLGGAALVIHVLRAPDRATALQRTLLGGLGLLTPIALVLGAAAFAGGHVMSAFVDFSGSIRQGTFSEGWRLPFEYLWHAEHALLVLWLVGTAWCLVRLRSGSVSRSAGVGLAGLGLIYGSLVLSSVFLHAFVVYGRLARQLVPFLCLATAGAIHLAQSQRARRARTLWLTAVALVAQATFNFATPLAQVFSAEFVRDARMLRGTGNAPVHVINAKHLYPGPEPVSLPPRYIVIKQALHPLQFLPYQYEGYTPEQRAALRSADISMRVVAEVP